MTGLPTAADCPLEPGDVQAHGSDIGRPGPGQRWSNAERGNWSSVWARRPDLDAVDELVAVERARSFEIEWDLHARVLRISVSSPNDEPALEAIVYALGLDG